MKAMKGKEKFVMTTPLLADSKGVKIGKSEGNVIGLTDDPTDLFGKIMALGDDAIIPMFTLLTDTPMDEIQKFDLKRDAMTLKKRVAHTIVSELHSESDAQKAEENFVNTFQKGEVSEEMFEVVETGDTLMNTMVRKGTVSSKSEFRRLIEQESITDLNTNDTVTDPNITPKQGARYKIGKNRFIEFA